MKITLRHLDQEKVFQALEAAIPTQKKTKAIETQLINTLRNQGLVIDPSDYDSLCGIGTAEKVVHQQRVTALAALRQQEQKPAETAIAMDELNIAVKTHTRLNPPNLNRFNGHQLPEPCSLAGPIKYNRSA